MFEEREVITLLLGAGVLIFAVRQRATLGQIQHWRILFASFGLMVASLACSVIEGLALEAFLNFVQHLCAALSAVILAVWFWQTRSNSGVSA